MIAPPITSSLINAPMDRQRAREVFHTLGQQAQALGVPLRAPPPEPTSCCGRGCNGCVWEGYLDAATFWRDDAWLAIRQTGDQGTHHKSHCIENG